MTNPNGIRQRDPATVLITGATGGIGAALAREYAQSGARTLILQGRNEARLQELATEFSAMGVHVETRVLDLRDHEALTRWLQDVCARNDLDLVVANAGVNIDVGPANAGENWPDVLRLLDVNVRAVFATVHGVLPSMRARRTGQIA